MKDKLNKHIEIYWWNMGTKTLDFKGTVKDCLKDKNITFQRRKRKDYPDLYEYHFKINVGSCNIKLKSTQDFETIVKNVLVMYLTYLGDRSKLIYHYWKLDLNKR